VNHLKTIVQKEGVQTEETALQLIAQKSEGCMRDALSILDKIVSFTNGALTYENTVEHLNVLDADYYFKLFDCMLNQDLAGAMLLYDDIDKKGFEGDIVLNGYAEFLRNLLMCKDERVAGLLEVVETFKIRYADAAQKVNAGYIISALNILNEAEINYKAARNKRLHVELALIKLCYLNQALQLTAEGSSVVKKKVVETARSIAFKAITPISVKSIDPAHDAAKTPSITPQFKNEAPEARLVIETEPEKTSPADVKEEQKAPTPNSNDENNGKKKISTLEAIRQQFEVPGHQSTATEVSLDMIRLRAGWQKFIEQLKESKNPAWQSFDLATLVIKDANSFEAIASNNLQQKFLEIERNKACEFLRKELMNRLLQFSIVLAESPTDQTLQDVPLSAKEQYQKIIEQYPLVKELKDRLGLELDY
ncbi:MAG: DNA polymerase III subunit gamma/tau, partial [Flavisolibacter sp.]|nr:DNA polymerase III subunit gamma/tau [Flavisolibacter sp.]